MREFIALVLIGVISLLGLAYFSQTNTNRIYAPQVLAAATETDPFITELNRHRQSTVSLDDDLTALAEFRAADMKDRGYFAHTTPDGSDFADILSNYNQQTDLYYCENLNLQIADSPRIANTDWLKSADHAACMTHKNVSRVGYSIVALDPVVYDIGVTRPHIVVAIFGQ